MAETGFKPKIRLVAASELAAGRGGGKRGGGERYSEYRSRVKPLSGWLKEQIKASVETPKSIRVLTSEIADSIGMPMKIEKGGAGLHKTSLYWGLKRALFFEGVMVSTGSTTGGQPVLVMRERRPEDRLPRSLLSEDERTRLDAEVLARKAAGEVVEVGKEEEMPEEVKEELGEPGAETGEAGEGGEKPAE